MAMLAEPRRRKRYNLCPRGKALYEDENRFGTKMLEKMGWTKGNGLGAKQDGEKDFVRIRFKNDAEGLGFEARDDQWTTHEEGFNGLLKSLNGEDNEANGKESEPEEEARPMGFGFKAEDPEEPSKKKLKEKISGMSLEERSKQSKARVHYKKFTRGKDLTQYSEKDLANIFGKKATDHIDVPVLVEVEDPKDEKLVDPNFAGVQTVSTGLSVSDYFKQKMEAMKNKLNKGPETTPTGAETQVNGHDEKVEETIAENGHEPSKKKKKKKDKERTVEPSIAEEEIEQTPHKQKKKKKSKRSSQDETEQSVTLYVEEQQVEGDEYKLAKQKKKKRSSRKKPEDLIKTIEPFEEPAPKKKKKSKKTDLIDSEIIIIDDDSLNDNDSNAFDENPSKKKNKIKESNHSQVENTAAIIEENSTKKKKSKKEKKKVDTIEKDLEEIPPSVTEATEKTSKKKKSKTNAEPAAELEIPAPTDVVESVVKNLKGTGRNQTDVSAASKISGDKSDESADEDLPTDFLSLDDIKEKLKSFNTVKISQFCAEKFHMLDMSAFCNSTLGEIVGYGTSENVELEVEEIPNDENRILDLWSNKSIAESRKTVKFIYPEKVKRTTIRAVKKRVAFQGI
uniref:LOW QUALITY PROTEIN: PIN2/TERF1-interacting telomerase inhibitor 1 n=1 Tax=Drosophila rhopaloa TaxID=1041015 RepID=A0A6P4FHV5_DRORH